MQAHNKNVIKFKVYKKGNGQSYKWGNISYSHEREYFSNKKCPYVKEVSLYLKKGGI